MEYKITHTFLFYCDLTFMCGFPTALPYGGVSVKAVIFFLFSALKMDGMLEWHISLFILLTSYCNFLW